MDLSVLSLSCFLPRKKKTLSFLFSLSLSLHALSPLLLPLSLSLLLLPLSPILVAPRPDVVSQSHQRRRGPRVERAQLRLRVRNQVRGDLPRPLQAQQRRVRRLLRRQVLPGRLPQDLGRLRDVEDVVDDLEGEADRAGVGAERGDLRSGGASQERAGDDRGLEEGGLQEWCFDGGCYSFFFRFFRGQREGAEATRGTKRAEKKRKGQKK